ncbi:hypothetical protein FICEBENF_03607 [Aeromonas hydrophila]
MSHQLTFADSEFSSKRRQTRKEIFLSRMEQILPWQNMVEVIEPFYPKAGNGRRPYPLETMLRIHCMQHWYNLSDGAMEDALYEIASMRLFARLSLDSALPDRTTIMNFRHLLEQHQLARQLFKTINRWLAEAGVMMTQGTLVDATIIEAPTLASIPEPIQRAVGGYPCTPFPVGQPAPMHPLKPNELAWGVVISLNPI